MTTFADLKTDGSSTDDECSSDEEYVPTGDVSDENDSCDDSDVEDAGIDVKDTAEVKSKRRRAPPKAKVGLSSRPRRGGIRLDDEPVSSQDLDSKKSPLPDVSSELQKLKEEKATADAKKREESLWSDFLSSVNSAPKPKSSVPNSTGMTTSSFKAEASKTLPSNSKKEVTVTKIFDFAGEEVEVVKKVDAFSKEARQWQKVGDVTPGSAASKRPAGAAQLLSNLQKKQKISTLDKSRLDWETFKTSQGISEELVAHNRSKDGFLDRKAFLERVDVREFEIEKQHRFSRPKDNNSSL